MSSRIKVYLYTRVPTLMQVDGYSLEAQKAKMKAFCDYNDYEIAGEYEDAGKLMISVLSAVAEIERENIRVQTMEGRIQKNHTESCLLRKDRIREKKDGKSARDKGK